MLKPIKLLLITAAFLFSIACERTVTPGEEGSGSDNANASNASRDARPPVNKADAANPYGAPRTLGRLQDAGVTESSGVCASLQTPDLFWTHNDSGGGALLYAFNSRGERRGVWRVTGATARDWEDIASARGTGEEDGRSFLFVGDIGDNNRARSEIVVYRILDPQVTQADASSTKSRPRATEPAAAFRLRYPDGKHDAEALMVHPQTGDLYIITKNTGDAAGVYKLPAPFMTGGVSTLVRVGSVELPSLLGGMVTGGDISPDGRRVVLCDYFALYEMVLTGGADQSFDSLWQSPLTPINAGERKQGEAVCYSPDGKAIITTSEGVAAPLYEVRRE